jgi:Tfp pilus assembly protein PilN
MKAASLELDHLRNPARPGWASWVLLAIALVFAADVARAYLSARSEVEARTARLAGLADSRPARGASAASTPLSQEEFAAAQATILRLSTPWDNVFRALEAARSDDIALLAIEPDAGSGSLNISGEARSYPAVLTYVAWLSAEKTLKNVRLARHELVRGDPRRPVVFTISADWKDGR